jgi:hypothetical protein
LGPFPQNTFPLMFCLQCFPLLVVLILVNQPSAREWLQPDLAKQPPILRPRSR